MYANVSGLANIPTYAHAEQFFAEVPPHSRCKKYEPHQRSLKPQRPSGNEHYRIERHDDGDYYDLILYRTVMARYYRPNADGSERRLFNGHDTQTSKQFMWQVCHAHTVMRLDTLDGTTVAVPRYPKNTIYNHQENFCVDLTFINGTLDISRSYHTPHHRNTMAADTKTERAIVREKMRPFLDLMALRMPTFVEDCEMNARLAQPFGGSDVRFSSRNGTEDMVTAVLRNEMPKEESITHFFELCQECFNTVASKRAYKQKGFKLNYYHPNNNDTVHDLHKPITVKELEKSVMTWVFRLVGANSRSVRTPMPQFMDVKDYPRSGLSY